MHDTRKLPDPRPAADPVPVRLEAPTAAAPMRGRFVGLWRWLLGWLFRRVRFPDEEVASLRALAERGTVVYVGRNAGLLPFLYFNWAFLRHGLPLAHWANGVSTRVASLFGRRVHEASSLEASVSRGHPALVFLWRRAKVLSGRRDTFPVDHAAALVRLQRESDRPIFLVPTLLLFGQWPGRRDVRPSLLDIVFGPKDAPGRVRAALSFLRFRRRAWVKIGEPIDLSELVASSAESDDRILGRKVRGVLAQYLAREERIVTGPSLKDPKRMRQEVLRDLRLRDTLAEVAHDERRPHEEVVREAARDLKEIAARYSPTVIAFLERTLSLVFHRIYDGIDVDAESLARVRQAARHAPLVLCPNHRSHVDYLVLSWLFYQNGLTPPHIAAGKNLSFWPLGPILRRGGAYFLRRSFKGDRVYSAVFRAYVKKLLKEGFPQEFFIEGTRSRSGKSLPPRMGMVAYEVEAFLESARDDVAFLPISIGYTRVIEGRSYQDELMGGEKQREDVRGLIKAGGVLRSRYGRIHIRVGEPISLASFIEDHGVDPGDAGPEARRRIIETLAYHVAWRIDRLTTVTPAALAAAALLSDRRRGMETGEVLSRATFLARRLDGAGLAEPLHLGEDGLSPEPIEEAVQSLADEGLVRVHRLMGRTIVEILPEGRLGLDYYKNLLIPFFMERSIAALALYAFEWTGAEAPVVEVSRVKARVTDLAGLLSREFNYRPEVPFETIFDETAAVLEAEGWIARNDGETPTVRITPEGERPLALLRLLTLNLVEGYWATCRTAAEVLTDGPAPEKEVVERILGEGRVLVLTGRIAAPEALSKPIVQAALSMLVERGHLQRQGRRGEILDAPDPAALERMATALEPFVGISPVEHADLG